MHPSVLLLDEAIAIAQQEEVALQEDDLDKVETLASKRAGLLFDAWRIRKGCDESLLLQKMQAVEAIQDRLCASTDKLKNELGKQMTTERKQSKYFDGYRHDAAQSRKAFYCDKKS